MIRFLNNPDTARDACHACTSAFKTLHADGATITQKVKKHGWEAFTKIAHPSRLYSQPQNDPQCTLCTHYRRNSPFPNKPNKAQFSQPGDVPLTYSSLPLHRDGFYSQQNRHYPQFLPTLYRYSPSIVRLYITFTNRPFAHMPLL